MKEDSKKPEPETLFDSFIAGLMFCVLIYLLMFL